MKPFIDRGPSQSAREAMAEAGQSGEEEKFKLVVEAEAALSKAAGRGSGELVGSGGEAIEAVLSQVEGPVLLPDQGIWAGTPKTCKKLGTPFQYFKTTLGLIDPETLGGAIDAAAAKTVFITSLAGYMAEQDVKAVSEVCKSRGAVLVVDASPTIGGWKPGEYGRADIVLGSAREPKLLNLPGGGFITSDDQGFMELMRGVNHCTPDPVVCAGISGALRDAGDTFSGLIRVSDKLKSRLSAGVIHKDQRGVSVGVLCGGPKTLAKMARQMGLVTETGRSLLSTCPRYDRFLEPGVVVELKKLDPDFVSSVELEQISSVLSELGMSLSDYAEGQKSDE
ncbi:hypothetical protein BMS3Bbin16_00963 [archaeon BMS3Bbin16]|nr:hypothetical protein BMS3Bbin16_00963 [archaeon BMS3Bbin16]